MMHDPYIEKNAEQLIQRLQSNIMQGLPDLVSFARRFAASNNLKQQAILLSARIQKSRELKQPEALAQEAASLVQQIIKDHLLNIDSAQYKFKQQTIEDNIVYFNKIIPPNEVVLQASDIHKTFPNSGFSLTGINLELRLGEITAVVGENGNGKTSLFRILAGELAPDSGVLNYPYLQQKSTSNALDWRILKQQIAYVPQELEPWHGTLLQNLQYEAAAHGIYAQKNLEETNYIIFRLGLAEHLNKHWHELSGGYKLRFALARALVWGPKLLILDEPLANLDVKSQSIILTDLKELSRGIQNPVSIILSSQHLHEIESISDRLLLLRNGHIDYYGLRLAIGSAREFNLFELECPGNLEYLQKLLAALDAQVELQNNRNQFIIRTTREISAQDILMLLIKSGIHITYFRDISQSIKSSFL